MRDVELRDHLERVRGQPAIVDPTRFVPPPVAATKPTRQDSLALWNWTSDGGDPLGGVGLGTEVEWDHGFRASIAVASIASSTSSGAGPPVGSSGSIGGLKYEVGNETESPSMTFREVGKPSEAPKDGSGGGGCGGGGGVGGGVPSPHVSSDHHDTANNKVRRGRLCFVCPAKSCM